MVGKFGAIFPMIGKIFRAFSNDWKKFSAQGESKGSARGKRKERKGGGREGRGRNAGGGMLQEYLECRCADLDSCQDAGGSPAEMIGNKYSFKRSVTIFPLLEKLKSF